MSDGHVTRNFRRVEFACKCGCGGDFYVSPELAKILQNIRDVAKEAITVTSGMRCPEHNTASKGAKSSFHLLGSGVLMASDITYADKKKRTPLGIMKLYVIAGKALAYGTDEGGGLGLYGGWVHVDVRRGRPARWITDWPKETPAKSEP